MKFRNVFLKYKMHAHASPDGGGTGGGGGDAGNAGDAGTGDAGNTGENNSDSNLISYDDLWDTGSNTGTGGDTGGTGNANANQGGQQQQQQPNANEQFQTHIDSLDFMDGIDVMAGMQAVQNQDAEGFKNLVQQIGRNAYRHSLVDANKVVQQRVDSMGTTIKDEVKASTATSSLVSEMNNALPFTKSPAYAPMAKAVLVQFLDKGKTPAEALEGVGKYFKGMADDVNKLSSQAPGSRPARNFGGQMQDANAGGGEEEPDWINILGGPAS